MESHLGKKIGDYNIIELIGSGNFGDVYLGKKDKDNSEWAIKIIAKNKLTHPQSKSMFKSEVKIMS